MDNAAQQILLFGDQADAPLPMLRRVIERSRHSRNLESFLQLAVDNAQVEVSKLTPAERDTVGSLHSVQGLINALTGNSDRLGIAQMVSVFIARIGELILHAESDPALLSNSTPLLSLGICGGLLPAAAVAVATNVNELIEVASYLAGVNCRVAVAISRRSTQIEDGPGSWAFSVLGKAVSQLPDILEEFQRKQSIPRHRRAYIAMSTPTWATIFGPPSVLEKLRETSGALQKGDTATLPAFGAVHAAHLTAPDFGELVGENHSLNKSIKPGYKLLSGSKYAPFAGSTLRDLLPQIMLDIFQNATDPARVFDVAGSLLQKGKPISLYMLGATSYLVLLRRSLHLQRFEVALKTNPPTHEIADLRGGSGSVAIVGMSGQFPGASNVDEMWEVLMQRHELHQKVNKLSIILLKRKRADPIAVKTPAERFDADDYLDETGRGPNAITTAYGCFLDNPGLFDHKMFNVSPREAMQMDPGQRLLMHAVYTALEDAGVVTGGTTSTDNRRIGTYIGDGSDDWRELQQPHGVDKRHLCVDSACGSTASAVGLAYRALVSRDCDTAIAGGANIIATPFWQSALSKGGFLSKTGGCKTFRADADGYCRGEAIRGRRAEAPGRCHPRQRQHHFRHSRVRPEPLSRRGFHHPPHVPAQERVYQAVLHNAGLEPNDISYVEMHGTGTTAGDSAELESIVNVLAPKSLREAPLVVGAIKANLGHSEAASGISSLMKAAAMFRKGLVPPQVGIPEKMGNFDCLDRGSILIPGVPMPFTRQSVGKKRTMIVNNFDAAGGNSCFVLEEPPVPLLKAADPRPYHVVTVSGHCPISFEQNKRQLLRFLQENSNASLADLSYTTTARRTHHGLRSAYSGGGIRDIIDSLTRDLDATKQEKKTEESRVVFAFTGQGAHYAGMGGDLFHSLPSFRASITNLQKICTAHGFPAFAHLISDPSTVMESVSTSQIHLALAALEIALVDLWKLWGIVPDLVIGHSIGEYAAMYAAGVLSATDTMYLVGTRATLLQDLLGDGAQGMLTVSGIPEAVAAVLSDEDVMSDCEVACHNSPGMVVLGGPRPHLAKIEQSLTKQNLKCKMLDVPYAMHSSQLDAILPGFRNAVRGVRFGTPKIKFISTLTGTEQSSLDGDYLVRQTRQSVKFGEAISYCFSEGLVDPTALWLEIGPAPVCLGLVRSNTRVSSDHAVASLKKGDDDWKSIASALASVYMAGKTVGWREYHSDFSNNLSLISLPTYAFDSRNFWMPFTMAGGQKQDDANKIISTCVHRLVSKREDGNEQSATFSADISHPPLLQMIQGHKLSGITVCPAGVFAEMALTAARYMLTGGSSSAPFPSLSVIDIQIDHPITPKPDSKQVVQVTVNKSKQSKDFAISIAEQANPSLITSKCIVRQQDEQDFDTTRHRLLDEVQPKIAKLKKAAAAGRANRFQGKLFYGLFSNLMDYAGQYEGVQEAIVDSDFTEALATIQLPKGRDSGESSCTLSPYWIDALTHLAGFLLNGNPMSSGDDVYIGTHMERMEIVAKDFSTDVTYQSYAFTERPEGSSDYRGHVYILNGDSVVGFLEGARFQVTSKSVEDVRHVNGDGVGKSTTGPTMTNGHTESQALVNGTAGSIKTLSSVLVELLAEETGMAESELTPSTFFAEIGVDSLMSISILADIKAETGVELNASFLMEHPTLGDAQRQLRILEKGRSGTSSNGDVAAPNGQGEAKPNGSKAVMNGSGEVMNGSGAAVLNGNGYTSKRECNVVLMQGSAIQEASVPLFLIADGAGSAAAYIHLPKLGADFSVYAVESPWVSDPEHFTCSFEEAASMYVAAVRAKQPRGPYMLGGWSAGGVFAYEVARILLEAGERVLGLVIIDITGPRREDPARVTSPTMEIIDQIGMLSGIERSLDDTSAESKRLKQHMLSTVTCFSKLIPTPMQPRLRPDHVSVIWAKKDIMPKTSYDALPAGLDAWFYPSSHDLGPNGWDALVGNEAEYFQVEGDHFSIMTAPEVTQLGQVMRDALAKCR
ncbi:Bcpks15 [Apiospora hydei]|uniref:Bcpks15 n=1 Tax=Apiospora hydei TaxID=1337664 RepID=A0ABR1VSZ0_9PEZI